MEGSRALSPAFRALLAETGELLYENCDFGTGSIVGMHKDSLLVLDGTLSLAVGHARGGISEREGVQRGPRERAQQRKLCSAVGENKRGECSAGGEADDAAGGRWKGFARVEDRIQL